MAGFKNVAEKQPCVRKTVANLVALIYIMEALMGKDNTVLVVTEEHQ
jgi:hypothetical protein